MIKQIILWLIANAVLTILVPIIFLSGLTWFKEGNFPFVCILNNLILQGFYIFSAMALLCSLFEEYRLFKICTTAIDGIAITILILCTCGIFYLTENDKEYVSKHCFQFYTVWLSSAVYASVIKWRLLKYKNTYRIN